MVRRNIRNAIFLPLQIRTLRRTCRFRLYGFCIRCRYSGIIPLFFLGIHLNTLNSSLHFGFSVPDTDFLYQRSGHNRIRMISGDNIGWRDLHLSLLFSERIQDDFPVCLMMHFICNIVTAFCQTACVNTFR